MAQVIGVATSSMNGIHSANEVVSRQAELNLQRDLEYARYEGLTKVILPVRSDGQLISLASSLVSKLAHPNTVIKFAAF